MEWILAINDKRLEEISEHGNIHVKQEHNEKAFLLIKYEAEGNVFYIDMLFNYGTLFDIGI